MSNSSEFGGLRWTLRHAKFWRLYRILGRLHSWSIMVRAWGKARGFLLARPSWVASQTMFEPAPASIAVANLHQQGFHAGLQMPPSIVAEFVRHAQQNHCQIPHDPERFLIGEVRNGRSPLGKVVPIADVDASSCPATARIAGDPALIDVAHLHLGYMPSRFATRLYWSPPVELSDDQRRWNGQTIDYHYDIERRPTPYVYFYLSDTDRHRGAHVVVAGSHKEKPLRLKWASTRQRERIVLARYGVDKVVVLEGTAGFGFFEDPACFHKVLAPVCSQRLMLQLRYG